MKELGMKELGMKELGVGEDVVGEMIVDEGMIMVGAAGRNVGKTHLAVELIRRYCRGQDVTGLKVTTIKKKDGRCPRGGKGCGVCSSLEGMYEIVEEKDAGGKKDTSRLLGAGAHRVFWLKVMESHLHEGITEVLIRIPVGGLVVCESNSLRKVLVPGLFLILKEKGTEFFKKSALAVRKYADEVILFDGKGYDFDINRIVREENKWKIKQESDK